MVTYGTFTIVDISDGAQWYSGTSITNTSTTPTIFPNSGVLYAVEGDMYLNTSTQNTYRCVEDGDASHAKWVYVNNIKGEDGVGITSIVSQYCLSNDSTSPHDGTWSNDVPTYEENKYYWTRQYITWDDSSHSHSYSPSEDGVLDNSLTDANRNAYEANNKDVAYQGVCNTGETVGSKVVTSNNFTLSDGTVITVLFTAPNKSTGLIQLNVNDTGNKDVYVGGTATGSTNSNILLWGANAQITFVYNSNHWVVSGEPRTWHGNCPSTVSAGTSEKTITISEVVICKGTTIIANMANGNTSTTPSLNITALGAINLYYGTGTNTPTLANGYGWTDNSTTQFVFDGLYWRMADSSTSEKTNDARKVASYYISSDSNGVMIADLTTGEQTPSEVTTGKRNVLITDTDVQIRDGQTSLALFGSSSRIGIPTSSRFLINPDSLQAYDSSNVKYFEVSANGMSFGGNEVARASDTGWHVLIKTSNINYVNNTATLTAEVYQNGIIQSTGFSIQWYKDSIEISQQDGGNSSPINVTDLNAAYTCIVS